MFPAPHRHSRAHRVTKSITKTSLLHKSRQFPKLCCLYGEEAGFRLPPQRHLRIFEMVLVSSATSLMSGGLPSIPYHIYHLWGEKKIYSYLCSLLLLLRFLLNKQLLNPACLQGNFLKQMKSQSNGIQKRGVASYQRMLKQKGDAGVSRGALSTAPAPLCYLSRHSLAQQQESDVLIPP